MQEDYARRYCIRGKETAKDVGKILQKRDRVITHYPVALLLSMVFKLL